MRNYSVSGRNVRPLCLTQDQAAKITPSELSSLGINVSKIFNHMSAMDAEPVNPLTNPSTIVPVQFAQQWLSGFVETVTAARKGDMLVGLSTQGKWEDEEVVQPLIELTGNSRPYTDSASSPFSSWNPTFERRTIIRFEEGMQVNRLEESRAALMQANSAELKRKASAQSLEIARNLVCFSGFNSDTGESTRTYGILNDPSLPAYVNVADGSSGMSQWSTKTFLEITADLRTAASALRTQSQERIDPSVTPITLALAMSARELLTTVSDFGISVNQWIMENYPNWRIESAPQFDGANGTANVFYLYADEVSESGSDDLATFIQVVPARFMTLGVTQHSKGYEESYSNATAGVMLKRPYAVVRYSGI